MEKIHCYLKNNFLRSHMRMPIKPTGFIPKASTTVFCHIYINVLKLHCRSNNIPFATIISNCVPWLWFANYYRANFKSVKHFVVPFFQHKRKESLTLSWRCMCWVTVLFLCHRTFPGSENKIFDRGSDFLELFSNAFCFFLLFHVIFCVTVSVFSFLSLAGQLFHH